MSTTSTAAPRSATPTGRHPIVRLLRDPAGVIALSCALLLALCALLAPWLAPLPPTEIDTTARFAGPSVAHPLGTDELGRDTLSRILYGGRLALGISLAATLISVVLGTVWGAVAGYLDGLVGRLMMAVADIAMAIPPMLFALIVVAGVGASPVTLAVVIGVLMSLPTSRVMRSALLAEKSADYALAAKSVGVGRLRLLFGELLPNTLPTFLAQASINVSIAIGIEASLSFIGLGIQPPDASWGSLLQQGYARIYQSTWYVGSAAAMILAAVWSFSVLGQRLQSILDPKGDA